MLDCILRQHGSIKGMKSLQHRLKNKTKTTTWDVNCVSLFYVFFFLFRTNTDDDMFRYFQSLKTQHKRKQRQKMRLRVDFKVQCEGLRGIYLQEWNTTYMIILLSPETKNCVTTTLE